MICRLDCLSTKCGFDYGRAVACLPVKFRPNISSSGGRICLGVVVLVIDSALASRSGNRAISSSCDCMLYGLWQYHCGIRFCHGQGLRMNKPVLETRIIALRPMATSIRLMALGCGTVCCGWRTEIRFLYWNFDCETGAYFLAFNLTFDPCNRRYPLHIFNRCYKQIQ